MQGPINGLVGTDLSGINDADGAELTNTDAVAAILTSTQLLTYLMVDDPTYGVPSDALLNTAANQTAVGAILTTDLLDGYLTTDNLAAVTNHLGTRVDITSTASSGAGSVGVSVALTGYDTVWESLQSNRDYRGSQRCLEFSTNFDG